MKSFSEMWSLKGKAAVVTGGGGILGQNFCGGLAECGARVAVVDVNETAAQEAAATLNQKFGGVHIGLACDVSSPESVAQMTARAVEEFGTIDILHNNAATKARDLKAFFAPFEEYSLEMWREIMAVNIDGMFLVAQAVGGHMAQSGKGGSIIQTSSIYGIMAPDARVYEGSDYLGGPINTPAVYSASKAAVVGLTKYLATYWAGAGIRVNTLTPGGCRSGQNDEFLRRYSARVPMARMGEPHEMVGALLYLASDASSYVTGQNIIVDGGLDAW